MFRKSCLAALFLYSFIALMPGVAEAKIRFGVLPWNGAQQVSATELAQAEAKLIATMVACGKFTVVERAQVEKLMAEQAFQISGAVGGDQAEKLGKLLSVDKLLQFTVIPKGDGDHSGIVHVIDVTSGEMEINENKDSSGTQDISDISRDMAGIVILKYPLLGSVGKVADSTIIVDIGSDGNLKDGDRLFAARREIERDADGSVIFEDYSRIGILRIDRAGKVGSKASVASLVSPGNPVRVGDLVSPAPIPERAPIVNTSPRLADYTGGEVILKDEFSGERMIGVNNNREEAYQSGQLVLDATHKDSGHSYGFYPKSLGNLQDFVLEFELEWYPTDRLNRFVVSFRSNGDYITEDAYAATFYQDNTYTLFAWVDGHEKSIAPNATSVGMEIDDGDENRVRIVAVGADVDFYLNDKFIGGFTDERFDHGTIGLAVHYGCKVGIDELVIRKAVKKNAQAGQ